MAKLRTHLLPTLGFPLLMAGVLACTVHMNAASQADANGAGKSQARGKSSSSARVSGKATSRSRVSARASGKWRVRGRLSARFKFSAPLCVATGPAARPEPFVGFADPAPPSASRSSTATTETSRPRRPGVRTMPPRRPHVKTVPPPRGPEPSPEQLASPPPPPDEPPPNVFGYETPVAGCFEGQVRFIPENSQALPTSYEDLPVSSVLYACEWDIPTRDWQQGFPEIPERFEWFAIRYSGTFAVRDSGSYSFRLASDDGARLVIDDQLVIDNDGVHPPRTKTAGIQLTAGDHRMVLEYFQGPRFHINLQLYVTPPGGEESLFSVR